MDYLKCILRRDFKIEPTLLLALFHEHCRSKMPHNDRKPKSHIVFYRFPEMKNSDNIRGKIRATIGTSSVERKRFP